VKSQLRKHLCFSRMVFALSSGLLFLPTGCANPSTSATPSASPPSASPSAPSAPAPTVTGNFTAVGNMTTVRAAHTATLLGNGKVLIAGGEGNGFQALASAELYDPSTRTFAPTGSMNTPRYAHSATLLADGRVLIAGGTQDFNLDTSVFTAEIYDPSTGVFTATGDLTSIGGEVSALPGNVTTLLPDGRVLVAAPNNAEIYDPKSGTFTPTGPYANPSITYGTTVTLLTNGKILVTGGCVSGTCNVAVTELFDPQSGTFGVTGPMMAKYFPDYGYTATLLTDGRVLFLGSFDFTGDAEVYDPAAGTFASIAGAISQELAPASRLADGTVLVAGGQLPGGNGSAYAVRYVPTSGTFEPAGEMTAGRHEHTATPLPDGTVLITGGFSVWPNPTSSAEVYKPQ
jgi:hypothetical protein